MPVLTAQSLEKAFGPKVVLRDVSVAIRTGERVGLVGINGSGKSTLARVLAGVEAPDGGTVTMRRDATVAYLEQEPALDPDATVLDVVLSARRADDDDDSTWRRILGKLGVPRHDARVGTLSGGERRRVALARILVQQPSLAVLDEPTNHLDVEAIEWLEKFLIDEHRGALLLITHDRYVLDRVVTRTLEIERGNLHSYDGGYEAYLEAKAERLAHEARTESNRQNFLRREIEWLRRGPAARTTKQKARIHRAEAAIAQKAPELERAAKLAMSATRSSKTVVDLRGVTLELGGKKLIDRLDLALVPGERVGVIGRNGTGKTTLLRAILGEIAPTAGAIVRGARTEVAYFDQARIGLDDEASIFDNVAESRSHVDVGGRSIDVRTYLERFLFDVPTQKQKVRSLSGGERARVALAKMMRGGANLIMLDEPTNDLDVTTLGALEEMLIEFGGSAIVVSHDRWFLDRVATSILAFEGDGRIVHQPGGYETYRSLREQRRSVESSAPASAKTAARSTAVDRTSSAPDGPKPLTYAERIELDGMLERIDAAEQTVAAIEARLADPSFYASGEDVPGVVRSLDDARAALGALMQRWEELETRRELDPKKR